MKALLSILLMISIMFSVIPFHGLSVFASTDINLSENDTIVLEENSKEIRQTNTIIPNHSYQIEGSLSNIRWVLDDNGCLNLTGTGSIPTYNTTDAFPWSAYTNEIKSIIIEEGITDIGNHAFSNCDKAIEITIASTVTSIGYCSFYNCAALESITLHEGIKTISQSAFGSCSSLKEITVPNSVTFLGTYVFKNCTSLEKVTLLNELTSVPKNSFENCSSLKEITLPETITTIGGSAFLGCSSLKSFEFPVNITEISNYAFKNCSSLEKITIPTTVTTLGTYAFSGCSALTEAKILTELNTLPSGTFAYCTSLKNITIPDSITSIGDSAFYSSGLEEIVLPNTITSIGTYTFAITNLKSVVVPESITEIPKAAFYNCSKLESITLHNGITSIGSIAFTHCISLKTINLPENITEISESIFENCTALTNIDIPDSVELIKRYAFKNCSSLTDAVIGSKTSIIETQAFYSCTGLTNLSVGSSVNTIYRNAFYGCSNIKTVNISDASAWCEIDFYDEYSNPVYYSNNLNLNGSPLTTLNIAEGTQEISKYAFYNLKDIKTVTLPDSVTSIGDYAFYECNELESISMPKVESIGTEAFFYCTKLSEIILPETLTSIASQAFVSCQIKSIVIPKNVTTIEANTFQLCRLMESVVLPEGLKSIETGAFSRCDNLANINIPSTITTIGNAAFSECHALKNIEIPDSVTSLGTFVFDYCDNLETVILGSGITKIEKNTFYYCKALISVKLPGNLSEIGDYAFRDCSELLSITVPDSVTSISSTAFYNCYKLTISCNPGSYAETYAKENHLSYKAIVSDSGALNDNISWTLDSDGFLTISGTGNMPDYSSPNNRPWADMASSVTYVIISDGITSIGDNAFYSCVNLKNVKMPGSIKTIGRYAFYGCFDLTEVVIPEGVEKIMNCAFCDARYLKKLELPKSLTYIGDNAFYFCDFSEIYISENVSYIGGGAFVRCDYLNKVNITDLSKWCSIDFDGEDANPLSTGAGLYLNGELIEHLVIPENITEIPNYAFYGYKALKSITLHEKVETIDYKCFTECTALKDIYISNLYSWCSISMYAGSNPLSIAENLWLNGELLEDVVIPEGIEKIEWQFINYKKLKTLTIPPYVTEIKSAGTKSAFDGCNNLTIRCQKGSAAENHAKYHNINYETIWFSNVSSNDNCITISNFTNVKDIFIAFGEYDNYTDINRNKTVRLTESKLKNKTEISYWVTTRGIHTVLVRHKDGTMEIFYTDIQTRTPEFIESGLRLTVKGLDTVKLIRTAYGNYDSASELKKADSARGFSASGFFAGLDEYTIQYRTEGDVTVIVTYNSGYSVIHKYSVKKKSPILEQTGKTVVFSNLDDLKVIRYAQGEFTNSKEIKNAPGNVGITPKRIVDGKISVTLSKPGVYTFCVQYEDESHNYYTITVE